MTGDRRERFLRLYFRNGRRRLPKSHRRVMVTFLANSRPCSGFQLGDRARVGTGTLYPVLATLERLGWIEAQLEEPNPLPPGMGRRRLYRLTPEGREAVAVLLELED